MSEYVPIPVSAVRDIGESYRKDIVIILAYDREHDRTHASTWGRDPEDKEFAVKIRDLCLEAIDVDMSDSKTYEDYRFIDEGRRAKILDDLLRVCVGADYTIGSLMAVRDGIPDEQLQRIRDSIQSVVERANWKGG